MTLVNTSRFSAAGAAGAIRSVACGSTPLVQADGKTRRLDNPNDYSVMAFSPVTLPLPDPLDEVVVVMPNHPTVLANQIYVGTRRGSTSSPMVFCKPDLVSSGYPVYVAEGRTAIVPEQVFALSFMQGAYLNALLIGTLPAGDGSSRQKLSFVSDPSHLSLASGGYEFSARRLDPEEYQPLLDGAKLFANRDEALQFMLYHLVQSFQIRAKKDADGNVTLVLNGPNGHVVPRKVSFHVSEGTVMFEGTEMASPSSAFIDHDIDLRNATVNGSSIVWSGPSLTPANLIKMGAFSCVIEFTLGQGSFEVELTVHSELLEELLASNEGVTAVRASQISRRYEGVRD